MFTNITQYMQLYYYNVFRSNSIVILRLQSWKFADHTIYIYIYVFFQNVIN